jgi:Flp pilus assembly protein TadG
VIAMPALLLLVLASVHVGLWFHARHIASAASEEGARAARTLGANDQAGDTKANQFIDQLGPNVLLDRHITVTRTATDVTVTVTGHSPAVIPGLTMAINATTTSPIESFRP